MTADLLEDIFILFVIQLRPQKFLIERINFYAVLFKDSDRDGRSFSFSVHQFTKVFLFVINVEGVFKSFSISLDSFVSGISYMLLFWLVNKFLIYLFKRTYPVQHYFLDYLFKAKNKSKPTP